MAGPDSTAVAALNATHIKPAFIAYLDIVGDPLRATTWPANLTFAGTGDPDIDGFTFEAIMADVGDISEVKNREGGSDTVTASLSGLILPDNDLLNIIGDRANWYGRVARLWQAIYDENDVQQGAAWHYYTGRMVNLAIRADPESQVILLSIESYLASLSEASGRTYLDQQYFDPDDLSARATVGSANGFGVNSGPGLGTGETQREGSEGGMAS